MEAHYTRPLFGFNRAVSDTETTRDTQRIAKKVLAGFVSGLGYSGLGFRVSAKTWTSVSPCRRRQRLCSVRRQQQPLVGRRVILAHLHVPRHRVVAAHVDIESNV